MMTQQLIVLVLPSSENQGREISHALIQACSTHYRLRVTTCTDHRCDLSARADLLFSHWGASQKSLLKQANVMDLADQAKVRIAYSGGSLCAADKVPKDWYYIPRSFESAASLSSEEWLELCQWAGDDQRETRDFPRALQARLPATLVAMHILCEGFLFAHGIFGQGSGSANASPSPDRRELLCKTTQSIDWWLKGLGCESYVDLGKKLRADKVSKENVTQLIECLSPGVPTKLLKVDQIKLAHDRLEELLDCKTET